MSDSKFSIAEREDSGHGRLGALDTAHGQLDTPAFLPVLDFIGGTTVKSGGIWSRVRNKLFNTPEFNGALYQAMSFLNFGITPDNLDFWRHQTLHDHFTDHDPPKSWHDQPESFTEPLFVDSGGYRLMQSDTFETAEGEEINNKWDIGTKPQSILELQRDYGADIIATLDFPIPKSLNGDETESRINRSVECAIRMLELLDEPNDEFDCKSWDPAVYVAIHGHTHDHVNQYVRKFLDRVPDTATFDGFAVGSLVPLRSNIDVLVDIVQGAEEAIPPDRSEDLGLHVFGISGKLFGLLSLLGVDSFDSNTYVQTARNRQFIEPESWNRIDYNNISRDSWNCDCQACSELEIATMRKVMGEEESFTEVTVEETDYLKSDFYAIMAHHNYLLYEYEMQQVRDAISFPDQSLLDHVIELSAENPDVRKGLRAAQVRDSELQELVQNREIHPELNLLPANMRVDHSEKGDNQTISLNRSAEDYNVFKTDFSPSGAPVLLVIPCSRTKPYSSSATHQAIQDTLQDVEDELYEKVSVSGLFGPVPEPHEKLEPILSYDYVLNDVDEEQKQVVFDRLVRYLEEFGDRYGSIIGYAASKQYRTVTEKAFAEVGRGKLYPEQVSRQHIQEHFRNINLEELRLAVSHRGD